MNIFKIEWMRTGATRYVFLIGNFAIKIPRFSSWECFLQGLICNLQEICFSKCDWPKVCPVIFHLPLGILLIMPRCEPISQEYWDVIAPNISAWMSGENYCIPVEHKQNSFGWLNKQLVALDYG